MRERVVAGNIYHIINRGVDKRKIFLEDEDYLRFIHDLFEFNNTETANNINYYFSQGKQSMDIASPYIRNREPRELLTEILAFCLMPNHYHLLLRPRFDDGIFKFIKKLNMGYAKYFNNKYKRTGALFEGRYKSVAIKEESHFIHLPFYIHLNPLDFSFPKWRNREIKNYKEAIKFLESYRWSSFLDYIGRKNFPSVTHRKFLWDFFEGPKKYQKETEKWLKEIDLEELKDIILE